MQCYAALISFLAALFHQTEHLAGISLPCTHCSFAQRQMWVLSSQLVRRLQVLNDPDYLSSVLGSLPGVDINDPSVQAALLSSQQASRDQTEKDKPDSKDKS